MKMIAKIAAAATLSALVFSSFATDVAATTVHQEQELEQKVECKAGSYGQSTVCEVTQKGKQSQTVEIDGVKYYVRNDGKKVRAHVMADTSVNGAALAGIVATAVTAAGAGFITLNKKK